MNQSSDVTPGSGNVYADLGFDDPEAELAKAELALVVSRSIDHLHWTEDQAGRELDITPQALAAIRRGRLGRTSIGTLLQMLRRMNFDVAIAVVPNAAAGRAARFGVVPPPAGVD